MEDIPNGDKRESIRVKDELPIGIKFKKSVGIYRRRERYE